MKRSVRHTPLAAMVFGLATSPVYAQGDVLVSIHDLSPRELRSAAFVLAAPQQISIEAIGAEPKDHERNFLRTGFFTRSRSDWDLGYWPGNAWILNVRTRQVVWELKAAQTDRRRNGLREFDGDVRLPAGVYEVHYASFAATWVSTDHNNGRRIETTYGGPYVDDGLYEDFGITVRGQGRRAGDQDLTAAFAEYTRDAVIRLRGDRDGASERLGFSLDRETQIEVTAVGEIMGDGAYDYGGILNADTHQRVWSLSSENSQPAGGAEKNRTAKRTLTLPAGRYAAFYATDDSHDPTEWNAAPPYDPDSWGLSIRVLHANDRAALKTYPYEPVPSKDAIVTLTGLGDDDSKSQGFTISQPLEVRVFALGEGSGGRMVDYGWIYDVTRRKRVWQMNYAETDPAGGADKNRMVDVVLRLEPGSYLVSYVTDDSHSAESWNSAPPIDGEYWGITVVPASGTVARGVVRPYEAAADANIIAQLIRARDDVRSRRGFRLDREADVHIYALGEGIDGTMYDYAWIEEAGTGRTVWEMTYRTTEHAGGGRKNRRFDGTIRLPAGDYVLRYETDGSHSFGSWNDTPPDDPDHWGVTISKK